jgi:hypothetical protein
MTKAISQLGSSESSYFGLHLAELAGFELPVQSKTRKKPSTARLLDKYQDDLKRRADSSYEWKEFADYLAVDTSKYGGRIIVFIDGPESVREKALLLEYGTPDTVANPLMRVAEAEFNEDFQRARMFGL